MDEIKPADPLCMECPLFEAYWTEKCNEWHDFNDHRERNKEPDNCVKFLCNCGQCPNDKHFTELAAKEDHEFKLVKVTDGEVVVKVICEDSHIADKFMEWMDGQGEQDMDYYFEEQGINSENPKYDYHKKTIVLKRR